jgi:hypothetical protein
VEGFALEGAEAARDIRLGALNQRLRVEGVPDPRRLIIGPGDDALAARAERRATQLTLMTP